MNELDFMIRQLGLIMVDIEGLDLTDPFLSAKSINQSKKTRSGNNSYSTSKLLKEMIVKKENLLKKIIEYKKNAS